MDAPLWTLLDPRTDHPRQSPDSVRRRETYTEIYARSIAEPLRFWRAMWEFGAIVGDMGERVAIDLDRMPGARFFPDATLNFAENCLRQATTTARRSSRATRLARRKR